MTNGCDANSTSSNGESVSFDLGELAERQLLQNINVKEANDKENVDDDSDDNDDNDEEEEDNSLFPNLTEFEVHIKEALQSRRRENGTIKSRRDLLFSFVFGNNDAHISGFFHQSVAQNPSLVKLHIDLMKCRVKKHETKKQFIGSSLFTLWRTLQESDRLKESDPNIRNVRKGSEPSQIQNLRAFIKPFKDRYDFDQVNATDKKQRNVNAQNKSGDFIADEFIRNNPDWRSKILSAQCPMCGHQSIVPHEPDQEILDEINALKSSYTEALYKFHQLPPSQQQKTKKPKQPTYPKQHLICL